MEKENLNKSQVAESDLGAVSGSLPDDEDIEKKAHEWLKANYGKYKPSEWRAFIEAATWMRDLSKGNCQPPVMRCGLSEVEFTERERLLKLQRIRTRWFTQQEFDRLNELNNKMFANASSHHSV